MKKQLLNESEIRKMMKFANIGALTNGFVERLDETMETEPEEEPGAAGTALPPPEPESIEEGMEEEEEELDMGAPDDEVDMDDMGDDDMDMDDMDLEEPAGEGGEMELTEEEAEVLISLGERLSGALDDEGDEDEEDFGDDAGMEDEMSMGDEDEDEGPPMPMGDELMNEVTRRVSKRLLALRR